MAIPPTVKTVGFLAAILVMTALLASVAIAVALVCLLCVIVSGSALLILLTVNAIRKMSHALRSGDDSHAGRCSC